MFFCDRDCFNCKYDDCILPDKECYDKVSYDIEFEAQNEKLCESEVSERNRKREYNRAYRIAHADEIRAYKKAYKDGTLIRKRSHKKTVIQKSYDGQIVAKYESTVQAARHLEKSWRMIGKACRGDKERGRKHGAYGYDWFYEEDIEENMT